MPAPESWSPVAYVLIGVVLVLLFLGLRRWVHRPASPRTFQVRQVNVQLRDKEEDEDENPSSAWDSLTPREREIAILAAQGYTNKQIADELMIAPDTVKTHIRNILRTLGLRSKADLRVYWRDRDWI